MNRDPLPTAGAPALTLMLLWLAIAAAGCSDGRPDQSQARKWFAARYPGAEVLFVEISEDEVVARSFDFDYRIQESGKQGSLRIQFMEKPDGTWEPRPPAPEILP